MANEQNNGQSEFKNKIALVSAPWPLFDRPSIQLGTLKAYLNKQIPDVEIEAHHFFLEAARTVGYDLYRRLSMRTWLAETVYGALLHPERFDRIEKLFVTNARRNSAPKKVSFEKLVLDVEKITRDYIDSVDWNEYGLAGFSTCLCQLTSSLYLMREIKGRSPETILVAGGSSICAGSAEDMLEHFPQIDAAVVGEGELPLTRLVVNLKKFGSLEKIPPLQGLATRFSGKCAPSFCQLEDLSELPEPDFRDYFELLDTFSPEKKFFPMLPAEISRGCWHRCKKGPRGEKGCAFCNLNLQWKGFRSKKSKQVVSEIENSTSRHKLLSVTFMDNAISPKHAASVFDTLPSLKKDLGLFCELRASIDEKALKILRRSGVNEVQVGVEALSTNLLKKLNKGTTAIENLEIMKHCEALGIKNSSNLILHFPGSDAEDVEQTLKTISFAEIFRPLRTVYFWLGLDSPVYVDHKTYGLTAVFNHPGYRALFPSKIVDNVRFIIQDYRGDKARQRKLWAPVETAVKKWKKEYDKLREPPGAGPILGYRDGRDFLIIRRRRVGKQAENHRLTGASRAIYLFCGRRRSLDEIAEKFPGFAEDQILDFSDMMIRKKLMFGENGEYLSLAVPDKSVSEE